PARSPEPGARSPETPGDPFQAWRSWYDAGERAWGASLEQMVGTPEYAQTVGKTLEAFLTFQRTARDNMRLYLETINMPSRDDLARAAEPVVHLEAKIDDLDDRLEAIEDAVRELGTGICAQRAPGSAAVEPPTRQLDDLGRRLDEVSRRLDGILAAVRQ